MEFSVKELIKGEPDASSFFPSGGLRAMEALCAPADEAESLTAEKYWKYPTYGKLLFGVR